MKAQRDSFGDLGPFAEPSWYNVLASPYYNESHRKSRAYVRDYIDKNVIPYQEEWEEAGAVPKEVSNGLL